MLTILTYSLAYSLAYSLTLALALSLVLKITSLAYIIRFYYSRETSPKE